MRSAPARLMEVRISIITRSSSIQPFCGGRLHHRVLAGDVVGGDGDVEALLHPGDDVEVGERGLHHHHVRALLEVERDLLQRLADVARVHLVAAAVAELRRALGGLAERPVEAEAYLAA